MTIEAKYERSLVKSEAFTVKCKHHRASRFTYFQRQNFAEMLPLKYPATWGNRRPASPSRPRSANLAETVIPGGTI
jgi:hypothetical protein